MAVWKDGGPHSAAASASWSAPRESPSCRRAPERFANSRCRPYGCVKPQCLGVRCACRVQISLPRLQSPVRHSDSLGCSLVSAMELCVRLSLHSAGKVDYAWQIHLTTGAANIVMITCALPARRSSVARSTSGDTSAPQTVRNASENLATVAHMVQHDVWRRYCHVGAAAAVG